LDYVDKHKEAGEILLLLLSKKIHKDKVKRIKFTILVINYKIRENAVMKGARKTNV